MQAAASLWTVNTAKDLNEERATLSPPLFSLHSHCQPQSQCWRWSVLVMDCPSIHPFEGPPTDDAPTSSYTKC